MIKAFIIPFNLDKNSMNRLRSLRRPVPLEEFTFHDSISLLVEDILVPQIVYEAEFRILIDHPERAEALDIGKWDTREAENKMCAYVCVCRSTRVNKKDTNTQAHTHTQTDSHAHANVPPKRSTVRAQRWRETHLMIGVTKLVFSSLTSWLLGFSLSLRILSSTRRHKPSVSREKMGEGISDFSVAKLSI